MLEIMWFAIGSARREAKICRLRWTDNDAQARTGMVRDAKHPTAKEGNHKHFKYTPEAWAIVERQPRSNEYIFPYDAKSVGAAFTRERGYQMHEVARFTLHESWNELKRYTNPRLEKLRELPEAIVQSEEPHTDSLSRPDRVIRASGAAGR